MFGRQPMSQFYADHHGGYLYIWLEGGNSAFSVVYRFRVLVAMIKEEDQ